MTAVERDDLDRFMTAEFAELDPATDPVPVITDIGFADRALRKIAEAERRKTKAQKYAADEIKRVGQWRDGIVSTADSDIAFWKRSLESWHRAVVRDGGAKTQKLPSGTVRLRAVADRVMTAGDPDETAPAELVKVHRSWIPKPEIAKRTKPGSEIPVEEADGPVPEGTRVHQAITPDGEIVAGVVFWVTDEASFSVTVQP